MDGSSGPPEEAAAGGAPDSAPLPEGWPSGPTPLESLSASQKKDLYALGARIWAAGDADHSYASAGRAAAMRMGVILTDRGAITQAVFRRAQAAQAAGKGREGGQPMDTGGQVTAERPSSPTPFAGDLPEGWPPGPTQYESLSASQKEELHARGARIWVDDVAGSHSYCTAGRTAAEQMGVTLDACHSAAISQEVYHRAHAAQPGHASGERDASQAATGEQMPPDGAKDSSCPAGEPQTPPGTHNTSSSQPGPEPNVPQLAISNRIGRSGRKTKSASLNTGATRPAVDLSLPDGWPAGPTPYDDLSDAQKRQMFQVGIRIWEQAEAGHSYYSAGRAAAVHMGVTLCDRHKGAVSQAIYRRASASPLWTRSNRTRQPTPPSSTGPGTPAKAQPKLFKGTTDHDAYAAAVSAAVSEAAQHCRGQQLSKNKSAKLMAERLGRQNIKLSSAHCKNLIGKALAGRGTVPDRPGGVYVSKHQEGQIASWVRERRSMGLAVPVAEAMQYATDLIAGTDSAKRFKDGKVTQSWYNGFVKRNGLSSGDRRYRSSQGPTQANANGDADGDNTRNGSVVAELLGDTTTGAERQTSGEANTADTQPGAGPEEGTRMESGVQAVHLPTPLVEALQTHRQLSRPELLNLSMNQILEAYMEASSLLRQLTDSLGDAGAQGG